MKKGRKTIRIYRQNKTIQNKKRRIPRTNIFSEYPPMYNYKLKVWCWQSCFDIFEIIKLVSRLFSANYEKSLSAYATLEHKCGPILKIVFKLFKILIRNTVFVESKGDIFQFVKSWIQFQNFLNLLRLQFQHRTR